MKTIVKSLLLFLVLLSVSSCRSYEVMHYKNTELDKVSKNIGDYTVYLHNKDSNYHLEKPSISPAGIKGNLISITDKNLNAEIRNPRTRRLLRKHRHDLNIYTKAEIKENAKGVVLKKDDVTEVSHVPDSGAARSSGSSVNVGDIVITLFAIGINVVAWGAIIFAVQGKL